MTYGDIYTKFMIEYDKANITSSYPSLTDYEIATILDKAYLALIAQKLTGTNPRRSVFESDIKAIEDLRPLVNTVTINKSSQELNEFSFAVPDGFMYYVSAVIEDIQYREIVKIVDHNSAQHFKITNSNIPWIKNPVGCFENNYFVIYVDPTVMNNDLVLQMKYIKTPHKFCTEDKTFYEEAEFQLSDTMAEELISLAITFALETVESPRIQIKTQTRALES